MSGKRLYIITDDARRACLTVFGIGLYGLPDWAEIVTTPEGIEDIPAGSLHRGLWHFETSQSRYMQRLATERWAAGELVTAPQAFMDKIEAMIAARDRRPDAPAAVDAPRAAAIASEPNRQATARKASKWH
ncbi:hypothetical protein [Martelella sp. FOR1707]